MNLENLLSFPQAFLFWISFFQYIESLDKVLFAIFDNVYVYFLSLSLVSPTSLVCCESLVLIFQEFSLLLYYFQDRKSTRLNSSHVSISYAVFCLKKKKNE